MLTEASGTWETLRDGAGRPDRRREEITVSGFRGESEGSIVAEKPVKAGGAKGPCGTRDSREEERAD